MTTIIFYVCTSLYMNDADVRDRIYKLHRENPRATVVAIVSECEKEND